jgi:hypothetical protein
MTHASRGHAWLQLAPRTGGSAGPHRRTFRDLRPFTAGGSFGPSWTPGLAPERSEELRAEATGRVRAWTAPRRPGRGPRARRGRRRRPRGRSTPDVRARARRPPGCGDPGRGRVRRAAPGQCRPPSGASRDPTPGHRPGQGADQPTDTVVVGVDGSAGSDAAVRWTAALAADIGSRVVAVHAAEPFLEWCPSLIAAVGATVPSSRLRPGSSRSGRGCRRADRDRP